MKIWNTVEDVLADFEADRPKPPPKPEPTVLKVATDRKLSVEGQRDRVMNDVKELAVAERDREQLDPNDYRVKRATGSPNRPILSRSLRSNSPGRIQRQTSRRRPRQLQSHRSIRAPDAE